MEEQLHRAAEIGCAHHICRSRYHGTYVALVLEQRLPQHGRKWDLEEPGRSFGSRKAGVDNSCHSNLPVPPWCLWCDNKVIGSYWPLR